MIEVEVKAKISSFSEMEEKLDSIGATKSKHEFQEDIYFNSPIVDWSINNKNNQRKWRR